MTYLNADEKMYAVIRMQLMLDHTGVIIPVVSTDTYQQVWYDWTNGLDVLRLLVELAVIALWAVNVYYAFMDFLIFKRFHTGLTWWQVRAQISFCAQTSNTSCIHLRGVVFNERHPAPRARARALTRAP
jgi:hypothetical protein